MTRRQLLAACLVGVGASWASAKEDARRSDFLLEEQIYLAQRSAFEATTHYQEWLNGRARPEVTQQELRQRIQAISQAQTKVEGWASPAVKAPLRHWARLLKQEVTFLLDDTQNPLGHHKSQAELQQRWRASVQIQRELVEVRRLKLAQLMRPPCPPQLLVYYQWKASLLGVLQSELELADQLVTAFESKKPISDLEDKAVVLFRRTSMIRAPHSCAEAQALYQQRFAALKRLCESAQSLSDPDWVANLQFDEGEYRKLALACDQASLSVLAGLLHLTLLRSLRGGHALV